MINKAITNLIKKNSDNISFKILNVINNENDFNNNLEVINGSKPAYLTWSNIQSEITELENEEKNSHANKISAINKLKGATYSALTDAEAKALFGV